MDKRIAPKRRKPWHWAVAALLFLSTFSVGYSLWNRASLRTVSVPARELRVAAVTPGAFDDLIPVRGKIQALTTVILDAPQGGVVEKVLVESGSFVEKGQALLVLNNTRLRLAVASNDTQITEQLNNLRNITNALKLTTLNTQRQLIDTRYRVETLEQLLNQQSLLLTESLIPQDTWQKTTDELRYQREVLQNVKSRQHLETVIRTERLQQIGQQVTKLEENLLVSQRSYEELKIRSPIAGQLTSLLADVGEVKAQGQRLGQVDALDQFKVVAPVSEFYLSRLGVGQKAQFQLSGKTYFAQVTRMNPEVQQGAFQVELAFVDRIPPNIRRGQSLQMTVTLGKPSQALLLPLGAFLSETGGQWAFVVSPDGRSATRRAIEAGRRNDRFVQVVAGLVPGERVIISSYAAMKDVRHLLLVGD